MFAYVPPSLLTIRQLTLFNQPGGGPVVCPSAAAGAARQSNTHKYFSIGAFPFSRPYHPPLGSGRQVIGLLPQRISPLTMTGYTRRANLQSAFSRTNEMSKGLAFPFWIRIITVMRTRLSAETLSKLPAATCREGARSWLRTRNAPLDFCDLSCTYASFPTTEAFDGSRNCRTSVALSCKKREVLSTRTFPAGTKRPVRKKGISAFRNDDPSESRHGRMTLTGNSDKPARRTAARGAALKLPPENGMKHRSLRLN